VAARTPASEAGQSVGVVLGAADEGDGVELADGLGGTEVPAEPPTDVSTGVPGDVEGAGGEVLGFGGDVVGWAVVVTGALGRCVGVFAGEVDTITTAGSGDGLGASGRTSR
jgi:hypothetical protein